jgi:hypothetical protein
MSSAAASGNPGLALKADNPLHQFLGLVLKNRNKPGLLFETTTEPVSLHFRLTPGDSRGVKFAYRLNSDNILIIESTRNRSVTAAEFNEHSEKILSTLFPDPSLFKLAFHEDSGRTMVICALKDRTGKFTTSMVVGLASLCSYLIACNTIKFDAFLATLQDFCAKTRNPAIGEGAAAGEDDAIPALVLPLNEGDPLPNCVPMVESYAEPMELSVEDIYEVFLHNTKHLRLDDPKLKEFIAQFVRDMDRVWNARIRDCSKPHYRTSMEEIGTRIKHAKSLMHAMQSQILNPARLFVFDHDELPALMESCLAVFPKDVTIRFSKDMRMTLVQCLEPVLNDIKAKYASEFEISLEYKGGTFGGKIKSGKFRCNSALGIRVEENGQIANFTIHPFQADWKYVHQMKQVVSMGTYGLADSEGYQTGPYSTKLQLTVTAHNRLKQGFYKRFMDTRTLSNAVRAFFTSVIFFFKGTGPGIDLNLVEHVSASPISLPVDESGELGLGGAGF